MISEGKLHGNIHFIRISLSQDINFDITYQIELISLRCFVLTRVMSFYNLIDGYYLN